MYIYSYSHANINVHAHTHTDAFGCSCTYTYIDLMSFSSHLSYLKIFPGSHLFHQNPQYWDSFGVTAKFIIVKNMLFLLPRPGFIILQNPWTVLCSRYGSFHNLPEYKNHQIIEGDPKEAGDRLTLPSDSGCPCCKKWGTWNCKLPTAVSPVTRVQSLLSVSTCFLTFFPCYSW